MNKNIKILSMNVRGLSNSKKRSDVFNWVKSKNPSIVCFQETHSTNEIENKWQDEWGSTCFFSHCDSKSAGVCVMFKRDLDYKVHDSKHDKDGRFIVLDLSIFDQRLTLTCLYGHNTDNPGFFSDILQCCLFYKNTSILLCGDWNVVQEKSIDTFNILHDRNPNSRKKIEEIIETFDLIDPWRTCYPEDKKFTWRQPSPIKQSRIDYFLVSDDLFSLMVNTKIIPGYRTDHSAILFCFSAYLAPRGKGYWKFNSRLLRDLEFVDKVKNCIKETVLE